ncbi:MAG: indolepyruvate oxidoreductase subunit beta [Chlorobi bacterium]|nr:indolepyruvate oxidoreductase subunit beta [Chlorobiota bacterium]
MKKDILLSGVGGQGILTIAALLDTAALLEDLYVKQSEVHGMSQRGGAVQSHVRISDRPVYSDLIPYGKADMILSVEPLELFRYLPYMAPDGWIITDINPYINIPDYPDKEVLMEQLRRFPHHLIIDARDLAKKSGSIRTANIVLAGAASRFLPFKPETWEEAIRTLFSRKGERIVQMNLDAFERGKEAAAAQLAESD